MLSRCEQLDLQALHRVRERLVDQRTAFSKTRRWVRALAASAAKMKGAGADSAQEPALLQLGHHANRRKCVTDSTPCQFGLTLTSRKLSQSSTSGLPNAVSVETGSTEGLILQQRANGHARDFSPTGNATKGMLSVNVSAQYYPGR